MTYLEKLLCVDSMRKSGKYASRIASELCYLDGISKIKGGDEVCRKIEKALDFLLLKIDEDGVITKSACLEAEEMLSDLSPLAKSFTALFLSHAHIDMNWMWGYNETASITVDTFRTVLDLMREYPDMTYAQSQASTYEIIEKFAPEMLDEIRARIAEGRWEVVAAEWVEPDKNMPDGESLTRQILQTKKYLTDLLGVSSDDLCIDFVPDTFGHNLNVPEILQDAGVKYMYHCRGSLGPDLYNYVAPSGKSVLAYREHGWYNGEITEKSFEALPAFCHKYGVDCFLTVFGVGDHGGGPSRRDIEHINEYKSWPLTPTMRFGKMREFLDLMAAHQEKEGRFPDITTELNCIFTGCYTTQSRIKASNRYAETRMNEAEALLSCDSLSSGEVRRHDFDRAWRRILFNHFHDILPGSGTIETREYALGAFQESMADITVQANAAMRAIASRIDTSSIVTDDDRETTSEGAGVGSYETIAESRFITTAERGRGKVRIMHFFNPTALERREYTEFVLWDYNYPIGNIEITAPDGAAVPFCAVGGGKGYWGHKYQKLAAMVELAPYGYTTLTIRQKTREGHLDIMPISYEWSDEWINDEPVVLENEYIRATFDIKTMTLTDLFDKKGKKQLISSPSCTFRLINENPVNYMTSWRIGPYMNITDVNASYGAKVVETKKNMLSSSIKYEINFSRSRLSCEVALRSGSKTLEFNTRIDWQEDAQKGEKVPSIVFAVPVDYETDGKCHYDIPYARIEREMLAHDVPALSFAAIGAKEGAAVGIVTDCKYGYRIYDNCASVTLLRSAYDPDPLPDLGVQDIRIGVAVGEICEIGDISRAFNHPILFVSGNAHEGCEPLCKSYLRSQGAAIVCAKQSEDGKGVVLRLVNYENEKVKTTIELSRKVREAHICDSLENVLLSAAKDGNSVTLDVDAFATASVKVLF